MIKSKSIYEPAAKEDGIRILLVKKWPEDKSREEIKLDLWLKEIAPTKDIDEWPEESLSSFDEFKEKYREELRGKKTLIKIIRDMEKENGTITLLYAGRDPKHNAAAVLKDKLKGYKTLGQSSSCV